jgi:hypothetical protein
LSPPLVKFTTRLLWNEPLLAQLKVLERVKRSLPAAGQLSFYASADSDAPLDISDKTTVADVRIDPASSKPIPLYLLVEPVTSSVSLTVFEAGATSPIVSLERAFPRSFTLKQALSELSQSDSRVSVRTIIFSYLDDTGAAELDDSVLVLSLSDQLQDVPGHIQVRGVLLPDPAPCP